MANTVFPGYRGIANITPGIGNFRFADASITATQEVNAPDLIMGDWDHDAYNYGPITVGGSMSGPVTETFASSVGVFPWACKRTAPCGELDKKTVTLYYFCGTAPMGGNTRTFTDMLVQSVGFSCAAGDVATFTLEVIGTKAGAWTQGIAPQVTTAEKLITWDKVNVKVTTNGDDVTGINFNNLAYSNFDFTINNNIEPVYSLGQSNLFPYEIVPGLRTITGTISVYNAPAIDGRDFWDQYLAANVSVIQFNIGALSINMRIRFHRIQPASSVGPIISTVGFTGVTHQTGSPWV